MAVRVASAAEAAALDAAASGAGVSSRALMRVAAANAATVIARRLGGRLGAGVTVFAGPGNNGGDGWAVAAALARAGAGVHVDSAEPPRTPDARAESELAAPFVSSGDAPCGIAIDALLGTGSTGAPRGAVAGALARLAARQAAGAAVVALDAPTGLDCTTGRFEGSVAADLTIAFGTAKRGHLVHRDACGALVVVDIGLPADTGGAAASLPLLADARWVALRLPRIPADAHKGTRRKVAVVAGAPGMGGAAISAADGALRAGAGLVKVATALEHTPAVLARIPEALTATLDDAATSHVAGWADALLIGPGLGAGPETRSLVERVLAAAPPTLPVVLDADALNAFTGDARALGVALGGRPAVLTPHPAEYARLTGMSLDDVLAQRFDIALGLARSLPAAVLLKGTPTVVTAPTGERVVSARGTPLLATGGSGDVLGGIVATLLAQRLAPLDAGAVAAWVHGRAAEQWGGAIRGHILQNVLDALPAAWASMRVPAPPYPVLAALPAVASGVA